MAVKTKHISEVKKSIVKEIRNSKKVLDTISAMENGGQTYVDKKTKAKQSLIKNKTIEFSKAKFIKSISENEKNRIAKLPGLMSTDKKNIHSVYGVELYFEYKKILSKEYKCDCNSIIENDISNWTNSVLSHDNEPRFVYQMPGWNDEGIFVETFMENLSYQSKVVNFYTYCVAMTILVHMALIDSCVSENPESQKFHFEPLKKENKEHPNVNLAKRMLSCDLYYYTPGLEHLPEKLYLNTDYLNWLKENDHLSFEVKYNKGVNFFLESESFNNTILMSDYINQNYADSWSIKDLLNSKVGSTITKTTGVITIMTLLIGGLIAII